ncbi:MAG TPA: nucleotidyltransferase family protein [Planctomycetota bacterium]|nr:nucleotidyltransferase family protein [Planctomycetota bacterium]
MRRQDVLQRLSASVGDMRGRFGVRNLQVFGSVARDEAGPQSDVDVLVAFDGPATFDRYFGLKFFLEDLLGSPVDLVSEKALRPELRGAVLGEAILVS